MAKTVNTKLVSLVFGVAMALSATSTISVAHAEQPWEERLALSFAPLETETEKQFEQFDTEGNYELHGAYEDSHELNDAWLGMPVRDASGQVVGYVDDAFLDEEGYLTELIVSLNGSAVTVFIDQKHVHYTEVGVLVDLSVQAIAGLEHVRS